MAAATYNLTFSQEMADRPLLHNLSKSYELVLTLKRAQLSESAGWVQVTLTGDMDEIQRAVADLSTQGILVSPLNVKALTTDSNPMP
jgi:hypothetical protein